jgi:hypothetical protein
MEIGLHRISRWSAVLVALSCLVGIGFRGEYYSEAKNSCATDQQLYLDGIMMSCEDAVERETGLSCEASFCPSCPYAGVCDEFCGYCGEESEEGEMEEGGRLMGSAAEECEEGELVDCNGKCFRDRIDTTVAAMGWGEVRDWLGNGCCDEGHGWQSDVGFFPDFNCPMYGCDGGDCEFCGSDPNGVVRGAWDGGQLRGSRWGG